MRVRSVLGNFEAVYGQTDEAFGNLRVNGVVPCTARAHHRTRRTVKATYVSGKFDTRPMSDRGPGARRKVRGSGLLVKTT